MKAKSVIAAAILALACPLGPLGLLGSQTIEIPDWENSVTFELVASQEPIRPGDQFEVGLLARIDPGYHLYGPEEVEPSRTEVSVSGEALRGGEPDYPEPIRRDLSGLGEFDLYEGSIAIRVPVTAEKSLSGSELSLRLEINYQVCTDTACSAPTSDTLSLDLPVAKAGAPVEQLRPDIFGPGKISSITSDN